MEESCFDIVELYKKGYSIDYIIDSYYKFKTRYDKPVEKHNNIFIIRKKSSTKEDCKKEVYNELYKFLK